MPGMGRLHSVQPYSIKESQSITKVWLHLIECIHFHNFNSLISILTEHKQEREREKKNNWVPDTKIKDFKNDIPNFGELGFEAVYGKMRRGWERQRTLSSDMLLNFLASSSMGWSSCWSKAQTPPFFSGSSFSVILYNSIIKMVLLPLQEFTFLATFFQFLSWVFFFFFFLAFFSYPRFSLVFAGGLGQQFVEDEGQEFL